MPIAPDDTRRDIAPDDTRRDSTRDATEHASAPRNATLWLVLSLLGFYAIFSLGAWSARHSSQPPVIGPLETRSPISNAPIMVHVTGAVRRPGVYNLNGNARVFDALQKAGGALPNGDTDSLNLADWAQDGARLEVPFKTNNVGDTKRSATPQTSTETEEIARLKKAASSEENAASTPVSIPASPTSSTRSSPANTNATISKPKATKRASKPKAKAKTQSKTIAGLPRALTPKGELSDNASPQFLQKHPLDLNKISREQLEALPGVGPSLAQKILDFRAQNGGFKSVDELDGVSGIGEKKLATLKPLLYIVATAKREPLPTPKVEANPQ